MPYIATDKSVPYLAGLPAHSKIVLFGEIEIGEINSGCYVAVWREENPDYPKQSEYDFAKSNEKQAHFSIR